MSRDSEARQPLLAANTLCVVLWSLCFLVVGLRGVTSSLTGRVWGFDHLRYVSADARVAYVILASGLLFLLSFGYRFVACPRLQALRARARVQSNVLSRLFPYLAMVSSFLAFTCFADSTHLLGDGGRTILEATNAPRVHLTEMLPAFLNIRVVALLSRFGVAPVAALEFLSCVLGALSVLILIRTSHLAGPSLSQQFTFCGLLLTTGAVQLFFGYVESYPPLHFFVMTYLMVGMGVLRSEIPSAWASLLLSLAAGSHLVALCLLPAHLFLIRAARPPSGIGRYALVHASCLVGPLAILFLALRPEWARPTSGGILRGAQRRVFLAVWNARSRCGQ